jgi:hypothetical protein
MPKQKKCPSKKNAQAKKMPKQKKCPSKKNAQAKKMPKQKYSPSKAPLTYSGAFAIFQSHPTLSSTSTSLLPKSPPLLVAIDAVTRPPTLKAIMMIAYHDLILPVQLIFPWG